MSIIAIIEPLFLIGAIYFVASYAWTTAQKPDGIKEYLEVKMKNRKQKEMI